MQQVKILAADDRLGCSCWLIPKKNLNQLLPTFGLLAKLLLHSFINRFPNPGDADHVVGLEGSFRSFLICANAGVALGAGLREQKVFHRALVGVPRRKNAEDTIAGFGLENCAKGV